MAQTRRTFLAATAALAAVPFARAQQAGNKAQVGALSLYSPEIDAHLLKAFKNRLAALGWIDGQTISYTLQYANNQPARLPELASELFDSPVSVIFAGGDLPTQALKKAGGKTPVVFAVVNIPVEQGLVESLARPGGTITGIATQGAVALAGKRLDDAGAQPSLGILGIGGNTDAIVSHREGPVGPSRVIVHQYVPRTVVGKGMLQGVDHQFGDDQAQADRCFAAIA